MGVFKILSVLAVIALATTVNCQDCQDVCEAECTAFVAEVADECRVNDRNTITNKRRILYRTVGVNEVEIFRSYSLITWKPWADLQLSY